MSNYEPLINQMRSIIQSMPAGEEFALSDILVNPPAQLGRRLFEDVKSGKIPNVQHLGKVNNAERYKKM